MILFVADDHYGARPGWHASEGLQGIYPDLVFVENDWTIFTGADLPGCCRLLILNLIAGTGDQPAPDGAAAAAVEAYCRLGRPLLLLHGGSAAFWPYPWWRRNCGLRWVRPQDPDGAAPSHHPKEPALIRISKSRHPLAAVLEPMALPQDEIYAGLEQTAPLWMLMETTVNGENCLQGAESRTEWGGRVINFLPGHLPAVTTHPLYLANLRRLIDHLLAGETRVQPQ